MQYLIVKRRAPKALEPKDLDKLFDPDDHEPPTARRPDLAEAWASKMNHVKEMIR